MIHALFDDALDQLLPTFDADLDLVWIDGHHEQIATIHYFMRILPALAPGAWVIFDDVSWSADMREAWDKLSAWSGVCHAVDLGKCGLVVWSGECTDPTYADLRSLTGVGHAVGQPWGWMTRQSADQ